MPYLLDTDHLVVLHRRSQPAFDRLMARLQQCDPAEIFVSVISFHEQMQGWLAFLNRARSADKIVVAYTELDEVRRSFFEMNVLPYSGAAQQQFDELRKQRIRIGTLDLRIASIGLVEGASVVTANAVDFGQVPGLATEDWIK